MTYTRRSVLTIGSTIGIGLFAGCTGLRDNKPIGTIVVENHHSLPHLLEINLLEGPDSATEVTDEIESVVAIEPNAQKAYESILGNRGDYRIRISTEDDQSVTFSVNPYSTSNGNIVIIRIENDGNLTYVVESREEQLL